MPEGDTIFRAAHTLQRALASKAILSASSTVSAVDAKSLVGHSVSRVDAHGKNLRIHFDDGRILLTHMRMEGSWHVYQPGERWRKRASGARVVLANDAYVAVCFYAPVVELLTASSALRHRTLRSLGPDLLAVDFDRDAARARLRRRAELPIGVAVMTQSLVAGIGNVYKSETLFLCGVDPFALVAALDDATLDRILDTAQSLMSANLDGQARVTRHDGSGAPLWVYGRSGELCARCATTVQMRRQGDAARSTYFCPTCQSVDLRRSAGR